MTTSDAVLKVEAATMSNSAGAAPDDSGTT